MSVGQSVLLSVCQLHQFVVKFFVSNNFFSHHFRILIANLSVFVQMFFNQVVDTVFYESESSIWRQTIVLTIFLYLFFILLEHWTIKKGFFGGKPINRFVNLLTISQGDPLNSFFFEKVLFLLFIDSWAIFFLAFRQKILCGVAKTALCLSIATSCGNKKLLS